MRTIIILLVLVAAVVGSVPPAAHAFINPRFTPVQLTRQADLILLLEFKKVAEDGMATAAVTKVIKGKLDAKQMRFDLMAGMPEQGKHVIGAIRGGTRQAMLFAGMFEEGDAEGPGQEEARGLLHLAGEWVVLESGDRCWDMVKIDSHLLGTWSGGTDMLRRAVDYVMSDENADLPCSTEENWAKPVSLGKVDGRVNALQALDLSGKGQAVLYVAADEGDKIFRFNDGTPSDVTERLRLATCSASSAWLDADGDGRLDLLSWNGKALTLARQRQDGTFAAAPLQTDRDLSDGCMGLAPAGTAPGRRLVIAGTGASPMLLAIGKDGKAVLRPVAEGKLPSEGFGSVHRPLVADFNGDGVVDILQMFAAGGLFYAGKGPGEFSAPVRTQIAAGKGKAVSTLGDFDADGLLDVLVTAEDANRLWHNLGKGKFVESLGLSGEVAYISKPGGIAADICDINNDGRQDALLAYPSAGPLIFFNRGFRSFGHCRSLDLQEEEKLLPQALKGQQAACIGDFDGDGAQDMVLALTDGSLWLLLRRAEGPRPLSVTLSAPPDADQEPLAVTVTFDKRKLGVWNVSRGGSPVLVGVPEAGAVTVSWKTGGKEHRRQIVVVDRPARLELRAEEKK